MKILVRLCCCLLILQAISGCARHPTDPNDPFEPFNRAMFKFNAGVDRAVIRPVAKVYSVVTPPPLQLGISNVFSNIGEITTMANDILQLKFKYTLIDFWRFVINTTLGVGGLFDIASRMGLPKHYEDFGMTLAYYSATKTAPYLVLPFLGPSTLRTTIAQPVDFYTTPWPYLRPASVRYGLFGLNLVNTRARLLPADKLIEDAFDPYIFVRNAYMQRRMHLIRENEHDYRRHQQTRALNTTNQSTHPADTSSRTSSHHPHRKS